MKNWIRIGDNWINLEQVVQITIDERRNNCVEVDGLQERQYDVCAIFYLTVTETLDEYGGHGPKEIRFFGEERNKVLAWLYNDAELEVTNLNFAS